MTSAPGHGHTVYGKAFATRDATFDHRNGHTTPAEDRPRLDSDCRLCMADYWLAVSQRFTPGE